MIGWNLTEKKWANNMFKKKDNMENTEKYISAEDITLLEDFINRKNKGFMVDGKKVAELYNRIMEKPITPSSCSACVRGQIQRMEAKWRSIQRAIEKAKQAEVKQEEAPVEETPKQVEDKPKTKGVAKKKK